jgi:4-amino-4-deoxy-L-arabinose transferase-like glycosyltransferase
MNESSTHRSLILLLISFLAISWFADIQFRDLTHTDEGRYGEIAREMVVSGDWLTPRLNDFKYFEKPPLHYWITASAYKIFGIHNWTARLWTELAGFLTILVTAYAGYRLFNRETGLLAGMLLAANIYFYLVAHINVLDMGLTFFMTLTLVGFLLAQSDQAHYKQWMLLAWAGAALALLSKGLMAVVLPGAVFVLYSLIRRDLAIWKRLYFWPGLGLFLLISAPWFVMVSIANPEFPEFFFIHEHFERFLSKGHQRVEPWWYFLGFTFIALLPWLPQSWRTLKDAVSGYDRQEKTFEPGLFLLIWAAFILLFFSISSSKLPHYIAPIMPALSLLFATTLRQDQHRGLDISSGITALAGLIGLVALLQDHPKLEELSPWLPWMRTGFGLLLLGGLGGLILRRRTALLRIASICLGWYLSVLIILAGAQTVSEMRSAWPLLKDQIEKIEPGVPVYSVEYYQQTIPFYLNRTLRLVQYEGELAFGIAQEPEKYIPTIEGFEALWQMEDRAFAVMKTETYERLKEKGLPMIERSRDRNQVLVERP